MENLVPHPSVFIDSDDVNIIRSSSREAEKTGNLHPKQLEIIYAQKWFKLLVPEVYTGTQITLPNLIRLQEAISWADGSTGWVVTLCSGAGWFGGFISPGIANDVFKDYKVCLAGSGAEGGTAEITSTGYRVNGSWKYASGIHHATHITANCIISENGKTVLGNDGEPRILPFIFDKKDVNIMPAWKYTGRAATGSDAFEIKNLEVAFSHQFKIDPLAAVIQEPLYRYPFLQLAEATLAVNLSGIAIHFMDLCANVFDEKIKQTRITNEQSRFLLNELDKAKAEINRVRKAFYEAVDESWEAIQNNNAIPEDKRNRVSTTSRKLAHLARKSVDALYPLCGLIAASTETEINRAWRDLHTASQHSLLTFDH